MGWHGDRWTWRAAAGALILAVALPAPALAQRDARLDRIETELRALQREVFPGGDDRYFEPEITPQRPEAQPVGNTVTTSALTDVLARLESIETQLARLTAATEVNENALSSLEMRVGGLETLAVSVTGPATATTTPAASGGQTSAPARPSGTIPLPDDRVAVATGDSGAAPAATGPTPARVAAVQAIVKPATGDAGEDEYTYGFRLWEADFFPEAQQQLAMYVERYPNHRMISYGRNLLGRAFLDAGDPRAAATHFFDNYQADKQAPRAPDSLLYLAESMIALGDTRRACIAIAEFGETYPALAAGRLQGQYDSLGGRVDCGG